MRWEGDKHYSDPIFIQLSCKCPINFFEDKCNGISWEYREMWCNQLPNSKNSSEAIIIMPGIYESVSSYFRLMPELAAHGYRVVSIGYSEHTSFRTFPIGFNELMVMLKIREIHFIGNGFGAFIILQLCSNPKKAWLAKSLTLINGYTNTDLYNKSSIVLKPFSLISAKSNLFSEFDRYNLSKNPSNSVLFVAHELSDMKAAVAASRIELRHRKGWPLDIQLPDEAIMSIETNDRIIKTPESALPETIFPKCKMALMKEGGEFPHLEKPYDILPYLLSHLTKWGTPVDISGFDQDSLLGQNSLGTKPDPDISEYTDPSDRDEQLEIDTNVHSENVKLPNNTNSETPDFDAQRSEEDNFAKPEQDYVAPAENDPDEKPQKDIFDQDNDYFGEPEDDPFKQPF